MPFPPIMPFPPWLLDVSFLRFLRFSRPLLSLFPCPRPFSAFSRPLYRFVLPIVQFLFLHQAAAPAAALEARPAKHRPLPRPVAWVPEGVGRVPSLLDGLQPNLFE